MIDEGKLVQKPGSYRLAPRAGVTDKVLLEVAGQYQNSISQKFLTASAKELASRYSGDEKVLVTTKYDGEGVFVYFEAGRKPFDIFAFNTPSGRVRLGLPALAALATHLTKKKVKRALLRAELYLPGQFNGRRLGVSEAVRVSFSGTEAEIAQLKLAFYDIIMLDGKDLRNEPFETVWEKLQSLFGAGGPFHCAEGVIAPEKQVADIFKKTVESGQEGVVIRRLQRLELVKVKPHISVDAAVIGYVEGEFEGHYGALSLLTGLTYADKQNGSTYYQVMARVGSGFTDQHREELLGQLKPLKLPAPLAMTDSDGRTVNFIKPQLIAEVDGEDLIAGTREDKENKTQLLAWDGKGWNFRQLAPCPRVVFPTFSRLRTDKEIGTGGARLQQIVPNVTAPPAPPEPKSGTQILRREVYRKESKGEVMVRKLVMMENQGDPEAFPFVIWWTDFSAKRKDPLKVDVAFATTRSRADVLAARFLEEGIAKGWVKADA